MTQRGVISDQEAESLQMATYGDTRPHTATHDGQLGRPKKHIRMIMKRRINKSLICKALPTGTGRKGVIGHAFPF